jgi:hypothetical protein
MSDYSELEMFDFIFVATEKVGKYDENQHRKIDNYLSTSAKTTSPTTKGNANTNILFLFCFVLFLEDSIFTTIAKVFSLTERTPQKGASTMHNNIFLWFAPVKTTNKITALQRNSIFISCKNLL